MTPEEQQIAIAEACPSIHYHEPSGEWQWYDKEDRCWRKCHHNDPLQDLNAMREAEKVIGPGDSGITYMMFLRKVCSAEHGDFWYVVHATAAQRAEAFLRTIGKWKD